MASHRIPLCRNVTANDLWRSSIWITIKDGEEMTRAEVPDLYYRTLDWKEIYYEVQAKMDVKKDSGRQA